MGRQVASARIRRTRRWLPPLLRIGAVPFALLGLSALVPTRIMAEEPPRLMIQVHDESGEPLPCRIHLKDEQGRAIPAPDLPFWNDHFVCRGRVELAAAPGRYDFEIERGPEWTRAAGSIQVPAQIPNRNRNENGEGPDKPVVVTAALKRLADLRADGWHSGDLHAHRRLEDYELLMEAEDLRVVPAISWWNNTSVWSQREIPAPSDQLREFPNERFSHLMAGEDERGGGALLYFHLEHPLGIADAEREWPSSIRFADDARKRSPQVWIDMEKPFWLDVPAWLASGLTDSVGIANNHMQRSGMLANEAWGKPRDLKRWPGPLGNGYWTQELYYQILNSGFRLPPSAGSASGVLPNPVGYNRVYAHVEGPFSYIKWWGSLRAGRSFVTNGPLLLVQANGQKPGHAFRSEENVPVEIDVEWRIHSNDPIRAIELIKNGKVEAVITPKPNAGALPGVPPIRDHRGQARVAFQKSGWFLVRTIADNDKTFRFASTAPFYVEIGDSPRIRSKSAAESFRTWAQERRDSLSRLLVDDVKRAEVLKDHDAAVKFWTERVAQANQP